MADVAKRDSTHRAICKILKYIKNININSEYAFEDVRVRKDEIAKLWDKFCSLHEEIIARTGPAEIEAQEIQMDQMADEYYQTVSYINQLLDREKKSPKPDPTTLLYSRLDTLSLMISKVQKFAIDEAATAAEGALQSEIQHLNSLHSQFEQVLFQCLDVSENSLELMAKQGRVHQRYTAASALLYAANMQFRVPQQQLNNPGENIDRVADNSPALPKLQPPSFDGSAFSWEDFRDLFTSVIHVRTDLSNVRKLQYLKSCLKGDASNLLRNYKLTDENYDDAWNFLLSQYNDKKVLINQYFRHLFEMPCCREREEDLKCLLQTTSESIRGLHNLGRPTAQWDDWFVYLVVTRLDPDSRRIWEQEQARTEDQPTWDLLKAFVQGRIRAIAATPQIPSYADVQPKAQSKGKAAHKTSAVKSHQATIETKQKKCCICEKPFHLPAFCQQLRRLHVQERINTCNQKGLCLNCLKRDHNVLNCPSQRSCLKCCERHNTMLHIQPPTPPINDTASTSTPTTSLHAQEQRPKSVLLATALVNVRCNNGSLIAMRAFLDQGSQASFLSESMAQTLRLPRDKANIEVTGLGSVNAGHAKSSVNLQISARDNPDAIIEVNALVIKNIANLNHLNTHQSNRDWVHLKGLQLADPNYHDHNKVDLLLGAAVYSRIILDGVRRGQEGSPTAQHTSFGWILSGLVSSSAPAATIHCGLALEQTLRRFWELEEISLQRSLTTEEEEVERYFEETYKRDQNGRFVVRLPLINKVCYLGNSLNTAIRRQHQMESRFAKNTDFGCQYAEFMQQYEDLNHMEEVEDIANIEGAYYIPHHAVLKASSTTTKLRVVFDASRRTSNGRSLNEQLHAGPQLQQELIAIAMRWRKHPVVFVADIEKMFRQIMVNPLDYDLQRIVWRRSPEENMHHKRLLTVTYGTTCASYLAIKSLRQLAQIEMTSHPIAAPIVLRDFYVDDLLSGQNDVNSALKAQQEIIKLLKSGGFVLKKWASNKAELLNHLPAGFIECSLPLDISKDESIKTLGVYWDPAKDEYSFRVCLSPLAVQPTKRNLLSDVARLYDPLGWLAPTIVIAKLMLQDLWKSGISWDDPLPESLAKGWLKFREDLHHLQDIRISRWLGNQDKEISSQLHGFCDASMSAYAAAVYVRVILPDGTTKVSLLASKSKVAPLKTISLPRLELCGAVLLAHLLDKVHNSMDYETTETYAWTDSTIVLAWLAGHPTRWNVFVANRVTEILRILAPHQWAHVPTETNPADCASRGVPPADLSKHALWWSGPRWLAQPSDFWPKPITISETEEESRKRVACAFKVSVINNSIFQVIEKFSSLNKLLHVTAYCLRFVNNVRLQKSKRIVDCLQTSELTASLQLWVKFTQESHYCNEISRLSHKKAVSSTSKLLRLRPILDVNGVLRVGGRLRNAQFCYNQQHPIILPKASNFTTLIIADAHSATLHGGTQQTLGYLQRKFWIVDARNQVRHFIHTCVRCFRQTGVTEKQIMADLPRARVTANRPFMHTAVDFSGLVKVRSSKGRGIHTSKAYFAVFVCLVTKAVHLELVSDLTSGAFIAAFKRFTSRRGICSDVYSDNGTNFVGANKEIQRSFKKHTAQYSEIVSTLGDRGTAWHFTPPLSPHFNGLVESGVRSVKYHLKRIVGESTLTFEELYTLLTQIECSLNSRPLYALTSDPTDLSALTPGHFLVGEALNTMPESNLLNVHENLLSRWQTVQRMHQHFWKRWSAEYFHQLYQRSKWNTQRPQMHIGNIVLLKEDNLPPSKWALGRVVETYPGDDGQVRVVTVQSQNSTFKRGIVKLALLPIQDNTNIEV